MMWRHLFEQEITSASFVQEQLAFERDIYKKMIQCQKEEITATHNYTKCTEKLEKRIQKYGLLLQYLVNDREKMLENQLKDCESRDILPCINKKQKDFIDKYYKQDLQFLRHFRRQLLEHQIKP